MTVPFLDMYITSCAIGTETTVAAAEAVVESTERFRGWARRRQPAAR